MIPGVVSICSIKMGLPTHCRKFAIEIKRGLLIKDFGRINCNGHDRGPLNPKGAKRVQLEALDEQAGVEAQGSTEGSGECVCKKRIVDRHPLHRGKLL